MKCEESLFPVVVPVPKIEECVSYDYVILYLILLKTMFFSACVYIYIYIYIYITCVFSSFFNVIAMCDYHLLRILKQHVGFHSIKLKTAVRLHYI